MILHITKKLGDWLEFDKRSAPPENLDTLYSWRANLIQEDGFAFLVFMNEASRYTICVKYIYRLV